MPKHVFLQVVFVCCRIASAADLTPQRVTFGTEDNLILTGSFVHAKSSTDKDHDKAPVALLLHMYNSNRAAYNPLIPHLNDAGFAVLAIDLRGHGESRGAPELNLADRVAKGDKKLFALMQKDVDAAYNWLAQQPHLDLSRFAIVGASVGCSIALKYAARDKSVDAVVCMTPGLAYMGIDSREDVKKFGQRPLLLLASDAEREATDDLARINPDATVKIFPGNPAEAQALHGTLMFGKVPDVEKTIADFLVKSVGPPSKEVVVASIKGEVYYPVDAKSVNRMNTSNLRYFTSPKEAEKRGLRPPKTRQKAAAP
jgi:pimeloyl-ACP methyl ester carboxylesterase